jgi:quinate dehydrogenase
MLDMCYHPNRQTRNLKLAEDHGWRTVQGTQVVGFQVEALWRFWIGEERLNRLDREGMWRTLREAADMDSKGRQALNAEILKQHFGNAQ